MTDRYTRVLLTGATGYLGGKLTSKLLDAGYSLQCPVLPDIPLDYLAPYADRVDIVSTSDSNFSDKIHSFSPEIVIHAAGRYDREGISLVELTDANIFFPLRVLHAVLDLPHRVLWLNTNTSLEYFLNGYSISKHQFADWGKYYAQQGRLDFCNLLLQHFYGEGEKGPKLFPFLLGKMKANEAIELTDGTQRRDFIYIDDVADAFLLLCKARPEGYNEIQVGTGEAPPLRDVVERLKKLTGSTSELLFGALPKREKEPEISLADTRAIRELGFECNYTWETGLERMVREETE